MNQRAEFTCVIEERNFNDKYSAKVTVRKLAAVRTSLQDKKIDLADVFITPISGQDANSIHNHFVIYDSEGKGLYIVRDPKGREVRRRQCTTWDLGNAFGSHIRALLKKWT